MGTWGVGSFENDDASDWVFELEDADDPAILAETLDAVLSPKEPPDAPQCCMALAAAEVVAAQRGKGRSDLPSEVKAYLERVGGPPSNELVDAAQRAIQRVRSESELRELWDESDDGADWNRDVENLLSRLAD